MHRNYFWQAFLLILAAIALIFTGIAAYKAYFFFRFKASTTPFSIEWKVKEYASDKFTVEAFYSFNLETKNFTGTTEWNELPYLNPLGAQKTIKENRKIDWKVWYDPSYPSHSSLKKIFPLKQCITAGLLWVFWIYFLGLGYYVAKFKT